MIKKYFTAVLAGVLLLTGVGVYTLFTQETVGATQTKGSISIDEAAATMQPQATGAGTVLKIDGIKGESKIEGHKECF